MRPIIRRSTVVAVCLALQAGVAFAHTISDPSPFHLSPGDYFRVTVTGASFSVPADVEVQFVLSGGGGATSTIPEDVVASASVGVRVPSGLAVGQYEVKVLVAAVPNDPPDASIWVRQRTIRFIRQPGIHLTGHPSAAFKDADFGDLNHDGFLDVFEANSSSDSNLDRLLVNKRGGDPKPPGCAAAADFCDETSTRFENSVTGVPNNDRTYDADITDVDLDGDLDLVRIDRDNLSFISGSVRTPVRLFLNDGTGNLVDRTITRSGIGNALLPPMADMAGITANTAEVDVGDVNGDGRPDLIMCSWGGTQNMLLINRLHAAEGRFVIANDDPCSPSSGAHALCQIRASINRGCAFGHFNGDDLLDIVLPTQDSSDGDYVLLNTGNDTSSGVPIPQFDVRTDWVKAVGGSTNATPTDGADLKVADLDGDGDDDVVIVSPRGEEKRRILWNDGGTKLVELADSRYSPSGDTYDVALADLDRDGDIDLAMTHEGGSSDPVMINRGGQNAAMLFEELAGSDLWFELLPGDVLGPTSASFSLSVSFGDYDLDGDHDLLSGGGPTQLWKNTLFDEPGEDRDWVFVLDRTRSMISGGKDFFEPAKNVIQAFLAERRAGDEVGLVTYDYTGSDNLNPNAADDVNKATLESSVGTDTPADLSVDVDALTIGACSGFCTAIGWAIKTGKEAAEAAPDPDREKVVVLVTDGRQNQAPHPDTIIPTYPSNILLYTVALGTDTDDRMLSALATNGGKFYFAGRSTDYESVQSSLRDVDSDIEADASGKQVLHSFQRLQWAERYLSSLRESPLVQRVQRKFPGLLRPGELVDAGEALQRRTDFFYVDPADSQVRFTLSWRHPSSVNRLAITDPAGRTFPVAGNDLVRETRQGRSHVVEVLDPLSGLWRVERLIQTQTGPSKLTAMSSSELEVQVVPDFPLLYVGETLGITATLSNAPAGVSGQLRLLSPSKQETILTATTAGENRLRFSAPGISEPGSHFAEVVVFGPPSRPFVRTWQAALHVAEPTDEEVDLRNAELALDRSELVAGGADTATATLRLTRRDGQPLPAAAVSFVVLNGEVTGSVQDHGDGTYSQTLVAGNRVGPGRLMARVDLVRLPQAVPFTVTPADVDPGSSRLELLVGPAKMCTNERGTFALRAYPVDVLGNPIRGADVSIEQTSGPTLRWLGPAAAILAGEVYERQFAPPRQAGAYRFEASVNGTSLASGATLDVFDPGTPEGDAIGCSDEPIPDDGAGGIPWWLWLLLLLLLLLLLVVWWVRRP